MTKAVNNKKLEEYVGMMLDNNKAYGRVHLYCPIQVLPQFGFPNDFVRCIQNLFIDNDYP